MTSSGPGRPSCPARRQARLGGDGEPEEPNDRGNQTGLGRCWAAPQLWPQVLGPRWGELSGRAASPRSRHSSGRGSVRSLGSASLAACGGGPELGQRTPRGGRDSLCLQRGSPRALCARPSARRLGRPAPAPRPRSFLPGRPAGACDTAGRSGPGLLCKPQLLRGIPRSAPGSALPRSLQFLESSVAPGSQGSRGLGEGASSRRHTSSAWSWLWPGLGGWPPVLWGDCWASRPPHGG